ncbi:hypothetical protein ACGYTV_30145, partial [Burkholderia pseudomallei]
MLLVKESSESKIQKEKPHRKAGLSFTVLGYGKSERNIVVHLVEPAARRGARPARAATAAATAAAAAART